MDKYKYLKYKTKYLQLKGEQKGGGAWDYYSDGNDSTHDLLLEFNFEKFDDEKDELIYNRDPAETRKSLQKLFHQFDVEIKKLDPNSNTDTSIYNLNYAHLGVIIHLIRYLYTIPKEYLIKTLIHAYRHFIRVYLTKESSGWLNYQERLKYLKYEILLLNYVINTGTPMIIPEKYIDQKHFVQSDELVTFITKLKSKNDRNLMDNIFLADRKIKSTLIKGEYNHLPILDPSILDLRIVMSGTYGSKREAYYIVKEKQGKHIWSYYQPFDDPVSVYLPNKLLYFIYGKEMISLI